MQVLKYWVYLQEFVTRLHFCEKNNSLILLFTVTYTLTLTLWHRCYKDMVLQLLFQKTIDLRVFQDTKYGTFTFLNRNTA